MKTQRLLILGAGALGSNLVACLLPDLRGEGEITVLDFDKIEPRNVQAGTQLFFPEQVGMSKTEALQYNLYRLFNRRVEIIDQKLTATNLDILKGFDLLIDTFDNREARQLIQEFALKYKIPCLHCGFSERMTFEICWAEEYEVPSDIVSGFDICDMPGAAGFVRFVAALSANVVLDSLTNEKRNFIGNRFSITKIVV